MTVSVDAIARRFAGRSSAPDRTFRAVTFATGAFAAVALIVLVLVLVLATLPVWSTYGLGFVTGIVWDSPTATYGAVPFIGGTLLSSIFALAIAAPVGILVAIFLAELAPRWLATPLVFTVELIAAIPSVVIGLWGLYVLSPFLRDTVEAWTVATVGWTPPFEGPGSGSDLFAASLLLALMITPTIVSISREVIGSVPQSYREAFLALGATRWETTTKVVLPAARTGVVGAIVLGLGRAMGETIAVTMTIGNADRIPGGIFDQGQTIASKIASNFVESSAGLETQSLLALGLVLCAMSLLVGIAARLIVRTTGAT